MPHWRPLTVMIALLSALSGAAVALEPPKRQQTDPSQNEPRFQAAPFDLVTIPPDQLGQVRDTLAGPSYAHPQGLFVLDLPVDWQISFFAPATHPMTRMSLIPAEGVNQACMLLRFPKEASDQPFKDMAAAQHATRTDLDGFATLFIDLTRESFPQTGGDLKVIAQSLVPLTPPTAGYQPVQAVQTDITFTHSRKPHLARGQGFRLPDGGYLTLLCIGEGASDDWLKPTSTFLRPGEGLNGDPNLPETP